MLLITDSIIACGLLACCLIAKNRSREQRIEDLRDKERSANTPTVGQFDNYGVPAAKPSQSTSRWNPVSSTSRPSIDLGDGFAKGSKGLGSGTATAEQGTLDGKESRRPLVSSRADPGHDGYELDTIGRGRDIIGGNRGANQSNSHSAVAREPLEYNNKAVEPRNLV